MSCSEIIQIASVIVSIFAIIASTIVTCRNTNKQIEDQNRETYRPRLRLKKIENVDNNLTEVENEISSRFHKEQRNDSIRIKITLENIGYGIANNIEFFNLINSERCFRTQVLQDKINQLELSTYEIAKDKAEEFQMLILYNRDAVEDKQNSDGDFILNLCNYEDLNRNNYKILIGYSIKNIEKAENSPKDRIYFDYYYYQEGTKEYNYMVNKYKSQYEKIVETIRNEKL